MPENRSHLLAIVGPTASGKSRLALALAKKLTADRLVPGAEIICCDSCQVYAGAIIGTAAPTQAEKKQFPHHLYNFLDPQAELSAGEYARLAGKKIAEITERGNLPMLVGGTGFYFRALVEGLFPAPKVDRAIRQRLNEFTRRRGVERLYRLLTRLDGASASHIKPGDRQRIVRALEVRMATGISLSEWQKTKSPTPGYDLLLLGIRQRRELLYRLIDRRVERMLAEGIVDEVKALLARGVSPDDSPLFQTIGYREIMDYLEGKMDLGQAVEIFKRHSRQYAKRQLTWFRKDERLHWIDLEEEANLDSVTEYAYELTRKWLGV
jgi:tRNA dimethylallyltransferase